MALNVNGQSKIEPPPPSIAGESGWPIALKVLLGIEGGGKKSAGISVLKDGWRISFFFYSLLLPPVFLN